VAIKRGTYSKAAGVFALAAWAAAAAAAGPEITVKGGTFFAGDDVMLSLGANLGLPLGAYVVAGGAVGYDRLPNTYDYAYPSYSVPLLGRVRVALPGGVVYPTAHAEGGVAVSNHRAYDEYGQVGYDHQTVNPLFNVGAGLGFAVAPQLDFLAETGYRQEWRERWDREIRRYVYLNAGVAFKLE